MGMTAEQRIAAEDAAIAARVQAALASYVESAAEKTKDKKAKDDEKVKE